MAEPAASARRALITGHPHSREALAAARALGAAGWSVGVGTAGRVGLARTSRYCARWHHVPPPDRGTEAFIAAVEEAVRAGGYDVVFGAGDPEALALSSDRRRLSAVVPYAPHARVLRAVDKWSLTLAAHTVGLGAPRTVLASDPAVAAWRGPAVIKPRLHRASAPGDDTAWLTTTLVADGDAVARRVAAITHAGYEALVQEPVVGGLHAMVVVTDRGGRVVGRLQQRALRTHPPSAGISARAVTVPVDRALADRVDALLAELGWFGLAQLQFLSPRQGEYRLIDFNGRFYGSLALAAASGLNLPATWAALALGRPVAALPDAVVGARYVWLGGDLRRAWRERRGGLVPDVVDTLRRARGATHSIASARDPAPALTLPLAVLDGERHRLVSGGRRRLERLRRRRRVTGPGR